MMFRVKYEIVDEVLLLTLYSTSKQYVTVVGALTFNITGSFSATEALMQMIKDFGFCAAEG